MAFHVESLEEKFYRIKLQNEKIKQRHLEVEADKKRASKSRSLVQTQVTSNLEDMMPAERKALLEKNTQKKHENGRLRGPQQKMMSWRNDLPQNLAVAPRRSGMSIIQEFSDDRSDDIFKDDEPLEPDAIIVSSDIDLSGKKLSNESRLFPGSKYNDLGLPTASSQKLTSISNIESQPNFSAFSRPPPSDGSGAYASHCTRIPSPSEVQFHSSVDMKKYHKDSSAVYGSGRLRPSVTMDYPESTSLPLEQLKYPLRSELSNGSVKTNNPCSLPASEYINSHSASSAPNGIPQAAPALRQRLPRTTPATHLGFPEHIDSPEQGSGRSFPSDPFVMPPPYHANVPEDSYASSHNAFGGDFSARGLPSILQMSEALNAMGDVENVVPSDHFSKNMGQVSAVKTIEPTVNINGVDYPRHHSEEFVKKLILAHHLPNLGVMQHNDQVSNGRNFFPMPVSSSFEEQTNAYSPSLTAPPFKNETTRENHSSSQLKSRPVLGRDEKFSTAKPQQQTMYLPHEEPTNIFSRPPPGFAPHPNDLVNSFAEQKPQKQIPQAKETIGSRRPILGRGGGESKEACPKPLVPNDLDSRSNNFSDSSKLRPVSNNKQSNQPKKLSALQLRMQAARNDSSYRFSRTIQKNGITEVVQGGNCTTVQVEGNSPKDASQNEEMKNAIDVHMEECRALMKVFRPNGLHETVKETQNHENTSFPCVDVRLKDKTSQVIQDGGKDIALAGNKEAEKHENVEK